MKYRKLIACKHSHIFTDTPGDPMQGIEVLMATGSTEGEAESNLLRLVAEYNWTSDHFGNLWECGRHGGFVCIGRQPGEFVSVSVKP